LCSCFAQEYASTVTLSHFSFCFTDPSPRSQRRSRCTWPVKNLNAAPLTARQIAQRRRQRRELLQRRNLFSVNNNPILLPARRPYVEPIPRVRFGAMNVTYIHCGTFHWSSERLKRSSSSSPIFGSCCHHNKVVLDHLPEPPLPFKLLFTLHSTKAKQFRANIRQYNGALSFTLFTANIVNINVGSRGPWVWKSGYTIYHRIGTVEPAHDNSA
jgi:hypothetical protein